MKRIKEYIFCHFYQMVAKFRKLNAREAALLYVTAIDFGITLALPAYIVFIFFGRNNVILFLLASAAYGFLLRWLNKKFFFQNEANLSKILNQYAKESKGRRIIGYLVSVSLLIFSPIVGLFILSLI